MANTSHTRVLRVALLSALLWSCALWPVQAQDPPWVEPRALNIADIAAQVPDETLYENIIAYSGQGLVQFLSSQQQGDTLRITVRLHTRRSRDGAQLWTHFNTLGMQPIFDHMGSVSPQTWLRLYDGRRELTSEIYSLRYLEPELVMPGKGAADPQRYPDLWHLVLAQTLEMPLEAEGLRVPANWGGYLSLQGDYPTLTAVFTAHLAKRLDVTCLGSESFVFQSYVGPGYVGAFQPLMDQLRARYPLRHPRFGLSIPATANYVLFTYPPMPFDVYDPSGENLMRPSAGTVRLAPDEGMLSQDLTHGGAFPLEVAWQDADQSAGPYLSLLPRIDRITPPEYVVPAGIGYDPCFQEGNCNEATLGAIHEATMEIKVIYLHVEPRLEGLKAIPLRVADETWDPSVGASARSLAARPIVAQRARAYIPWVLCFRAPTARPLGFFDRGDGRMVGYWP